MHIENEVVSFLEDNKFLEKVYQRGVDYRKYANEKYKQDFKLDHGKDLDACTYLYDCGKMTAEEFIELTGKKREEFSDKKLAIEH